MTISQYIIFGLSYILIFIDNPGYDIRPSGTSIIAEHNANAET